MWMDEKERTACQIFIQEYFSRMWTVWWHQVLEMLKCQSKELEFADEVEVI